VFVHDSECGKRRFSGSRDCGRIERPFFDVNEFETINRLLPEGNNPVHAFEATNPWPVNCTRILYRYSSGKARVLLEKGRATEALTIVQTA
jgi:hypothetical protein